MSKKHKGGKPALAEWRAGVAGSRSEAPSFIASVKIRDDGIVIFRNEAGELDGVLALAPGTYLRRVGPWPRPQPEVPGKTIDDVRGGRSPKSWRTPETSVPAEPAGATA